MPYLVRLADALAVLLGGAVALDARGALLPRSMSRAQVWPATTPTGLGGGAGFCPAARPGLSFLAWGRVAHHAGRRGGSLAHGARPDSALAVSVQSSDDYSRIWFALWAGLTLLFLWLERLALYLASAGLAPPRCLTFATWRWLVPDPVPRISSRAWQLMVGAVIRFLSKSLIQPRPRWSTDEYGDEGPEQFLCRYPTKRRFERRCTPCATAPPPYALCRICLPSVWLIMGSAMSSA